MVQLGAQHKVGPYLEPWICRLIWIFAVVTSILSSKHILVDLNWRRSSTSPSRKNFTDNGQTIVRSTIVGTRIAIDNIQHVTCLSCSSSFCSAAQSCKQL